METIKLKTDNIWVNIARRYPLYLSQNMDICRMARRVMVSLFLTITITISIFGVGLILLTGVEVNYDMYSPIIALAYFLGKLTIVGGMFMIIGGIIFTILPKIKSILEKNNWCQPIDAIWDVESLSNRIAGTWGMDLICQTSMCERRLLTSFSIFFTILSSHMLFGIATLGTLLVLGVKPLIFNSYIQGTLMFSLIMFLGIILYIFAIIVGFSVYLLYNKITSRKSVEESTQRDIFLSEVKNSHKNKFCRYLEIDGE